MKLRAAFIALGVCFASIQGVQAQVVVVPVAPVLLEGGYVQGKGWGVNYQRRNLALSAYSSSGSYGYSGPVVGIGPYSLVPPIPAYYVVAPPPVTGVMTGRVSINYFAPTPLARPADWRSETEGIDLDLLQPKKAPRDEPPVPAPKVPEPPIPEKEPALPGIDVSKPKPPVRPRPDEPKVNEPPPKPNLPEPPPPKDKPKDLSARLIDMGLDAFAAQEYGIAANRFLQSSLIEAKFPLPHFLLAQAQFALAKYDEAVASIDAGMRVHKTWPTVPFHPRVEMYLANEADFVAHLKRLEEVIAKKANGDLLFLFAYQLWFDRRRMDAVPLFQQARELTKENANIERFLAAAAAGPVAAKK